MKLEKINLVGFKSFPDHVAVDIVSGMTAIVGPNGCGKSNIVDAVNWVLGHDSRGLRAVHADDVVFSGSSARKALGLASVELVFDNTDDNTDGGKYAAYNQIAIRRSVDRSRESKYSINNTRCRRRDIHDLFADTGLGVHGYALIGQGMISRIIDAKPDEMRLYIEEVAGLSKYRVRKSDALRRMQRTRENLARVQDICDELERQLRKVKRQAKDAERFKVLKKTQHQLNVQLLTADYKQHERLRLHHEKQLSELASDMANNRTALLVLETRMRELRTSQDACGEQFAKTREQFYEVNARIAAVEQDIANRRDSAEQLAAEQKALDLAIQQCATRDKEQQQRQLQLREQSDVARQAIERAGEGLADCQLQLADAEKKQARLRLEWDIHHGSSKEILDSVEVYRVKIAYCVKELQTMQSRRVGLEQRKAAIAPHAARTREEQEKQALQALERVLSQHEHHLSEHAQQATRLQSEIDTVLHDAHEASIRMQDLRGRLASLKAIQDEMEQRVPQDFIAWMRQNDLHKTRKIADYLEVDAQWEKAIEQVLGSLLSAVEVASLDDYIEASTTLKSGHLAMIETAAPSDSMQPNSVARKIKNSPAIQALLMHIYTVDDRPQALQQRHQLAAHESLLSADGLWLGKHWLRLHRDYGGGGILSRRRQIDELHVGLRRAEKKVASLQADTVSLRSQLHDCEAAREQARLQLQGTMKELSDLKLRMQQTATQIRQEDDLMRELDSELNRLEKYENEMRQQHDTLKKEYERAAALASQHDDSTQVLKQQRVASEEAVDALRSRLAEQQQQLHELEIEQHSAATEIRALDETIGQNRQQHSDLMRRRATIQKSAHSSREPISRLQAERRDLLDERSKLEAAVSKCNETLAECQSTRREVETQHASLSEIKEDRQKQREQLHALHQTEVLRCGDLAQKLSELGCDFEQLPEDETPSDSDQLRADLQKVSQRLSRMGAVNLIALEEYAELNERKEYLDNQHQDLNAALAAINQAIDKIDRKTKEKFKQTFEQINYQFGTLFKRLFNGGQARLELVTQNWLESGVSVMVSPPGKKLSSISLLSGGEKALAALAVVFAIFELRPAPFCILDEVDAPLDEHNILNFCKLMKNMSNRVQFIVITHSRLTMESVDALIGVTMAEPGVSRLVAVDIGEAVHMVNR